VNSLLKYITNIFSQIAKVVFAITIAIAVSKNSFAKEKSYYELQSELVYNFIDHVNWSQVVAETTKSRNLCIMEDNPVIPYLNK
jgi:hypothetical protein